MEIIISELNAFLQSDSTAREEEKFEVVETTTDLRYLIELKQNGNLISVWSCDYDKADIGLIEKTKRSFIYGVLLNGMYGIVKMYNDNKMDNLELRDEHFQILDQPVMTNETERFLLYATGTFPVLEQEEPYEFLLVTTRVIHKGGSREREIELGKMWIRNKWDSTLNRGKWAEKDNYQFEVGREKKKFTLDSTRLHEIVINTEPKIDVEERLKEK